VDGVSYSRGFRRSTGVLSGIRILLVADREEGQGLAAILHLAGAEVLSLTEPKRVLEMLEHAHANVLVVDRSMRTVDGRSVVDAVRGAGASWSTTPVVGLLACGGRTEMTPTRVEAELPMTALPSELIRAVAEIAQRRGR